MLIITNAFVFQSSLAGKPEMEQVSSLAHLTTDTDTPISYSDVLKDWNIIHAVNYRHIFDVARQLVDAIATDDELVGKVLSILCRAARELVSKGIAQVHELAGIVFQRLIVDRKYIKANYTRPEAVALLSTLVLPMEHQHNDNVHKLKVADFACGTGALLNGVYQRILSMYEQTGRIGSDIHRRMMEYNIGGCDIMPNASHLTAALLTSTYPDTKIGQTRIHTLPYGKQADGSYALGALDLLNEPEQTLTFHLMERESRQVGGEGDTTVDRQRAFQHREFDIVVDIRLSANPMLIVAAAFRNRCLKAVNAAKRIQPQCVAPSEKKTSASPMDRQDSPPTSLIWQIGCLNQTENQRWASFYQRQPSLLHIGKKSAI